jgi:hypothetical protein
MWRIADPGGIEQRNGGFLHSFIGESTLSTRWGQSIWGGKTLALVHEAACQARAFDGTPRDDEHGNQEPS